MRFSGCSTPTELGSTLPVKCWRNSHAESPNRPGQVTADHPTESFTQFYVLHSLHAMTLPDRGRTLLLVLPIFLSRLMGGLGIFVRPRPPSHVQRQCHRCIIANCELLHKKR